MSAAGRSVSWPTKMGQLYSGPYCVAGHVLYVVQDKKCEFVTYEIIKNRFHFVVQLFHHMGGYIA